MNDYICTKDYHNNYLQGMINSLENSISRAKYYEQNDDIRYLNESNEWITVASVYMREILNTYNKGKE
jgi:hypothetical protein